MESDAEVRDEHEAQAASHGSAYEQAVPRLSREAWRPRQVAPLPCLSLGDDELCLRLDAWIQTAECNGTPGEGSLAWEAHIEEMADLFPGSVVDKSTIEKNR